MCPREPASRSMTPGSLHPTTWSPLGSSGPSSKTQPQVLAPLRPLGLGHARGHTVHMFSALGRIPASSMHTSTKPWNAVPIVTERVFMYCIFSTGTSAGRVM